MSICSLDSLVLDTQTYLILHLEQMESLLLLGVPILQHIRVYPRSTWPDFKTSGVLVECHSFFISSPISHTLLSSENSYYFLHCSFFYYI